MRHEIPTHLTIEDTVMLGMTMRQVMLIAVGATLAYGFWLRLATMPAARWPITAICVLLALAFAFITPAGRTLEAWCGTMIRYLILPKTYTWQRRREGGTHA